MTETRKESRAAETSEEVSGHLSYRIELLNEQEEDSARLLGRAASASLARAIFAAAETEYPGRQVVLRRGTRIIARSR